LYERYKYFNGNIEKGLIILPCELIDKNGQKLYEIVLRYAVEWKFEKGFINWLDSANIFANTLVDRIVSGYPHGEAEEICNKLGYNDKLLDVCEPFLLWVIEADKKILNKFPLHNSGLDIVVTDDLTPYRTRKVRILNGAHTISVPAGHICGFETVEQMINDNIFYKYITKGIFDEIIPTFKGDKLNEYALDVIERFKNPYLNHKLLSISLNSISKFKTRVLPSIKDYVKIKDKAPYILTFSLAALIYFYQTGIDKFVNDEAKYISELKNIFNNHTEQENIVKAVMQNKILWEEDLTHIKYVEKAVTDHYLLILKKGMEKALREIVYD
jgi:tagaturonate reductase